MQKAEVNLQGVAIVPRLKTTAINQVDIAEYLNSYSDFTFELQVLKQLTDLNFKCTHGGTYDDPVTGKAREFDIRAIFQTGSFQTGYFRLSLSVECKNIRDNFPLVLHSLKRSKPESYNDLIITLKSGSNHSGSSLVHGAGGYFKPRVLHLQSLYKQNEYVAKSADQVGRSISDSSITATDGDVFDKISQAINSAVDLINEAIYLDTKDYGYLTFVCPVLVVPDGVLWQVKYSDSGAQDGEPEQISRASYYVGREWAAGNKLNPFHYSLSHLEIVTFSALNDFTQYLTDALDLWKEGAEAGQFRPYG